MKKLNFGSGALFMDGYDNVDIQKGEGIYKSFNFDKFPYPLESNTYDYIFSSMVLEHIEKREEAINELHRICKKGAIIHIQVAYWNNKGAWNDIGDKRGFTEVTFKNLVDNGTYINKIKRFELVKIKIVPTKIGKFLPESLRKKLNLFISGLISQIHVDLKVIK